MSILDTIKEIVGLRKPTDEDLKMAAMEMDPFMCKDGYIPYRSGNKRFYFRRRKKQEGDEVKVVGIGKVIGED